MTQSRKHLILYHLQIYLLRLILRPGGVSEGGGNLDEFIYKSEKFRGFAAKTLNIKLFLQIFFDVSPHYWSDQCNFFFNSETCFVFPKFERLRGEGGGEFGVRPPIHFFLVTPL